MNVVIYRKAVGNGKQPKVSKAQAATIEHRMSLVCRVRRPSLEQFITSGLFYSLPALPPKVIDNKARRLLEHSGDGWVVPADSLGRAAAANRSTAQSVLLWVKQNLSEYVDPDCVSVVVE